MDDAELELAVKAIVDSRVINSGQVCNCAERIIARKCRPDKRSASGNFAFIITLKPGKPGFFILICNNPKKCEVPRRFHISLLRLIFKFLKI